MYYIIFGLLWLVSLLPLVILYRFADLAYLIVYYIIRYRRDIVMSNLAQAFPEKTEKERIRIAKKFYLNLMDTFIESIKFISLSKRAIQRRAKSDFTMVDDLVARGHSLNLMAAHQFNWEFGHQLYAIHMTIPYIGIYIPITNPALNKIFLDMRKKHGAIMISAREAGKKLHTVLSGQFALALAADQNPGNPANAYWMNFFGRPTPFVTGPAKGAVVKENIAVVMFGFRKLRRGRYEFFPRLLAENGAAYTPQQLTVMYKNAVEDIIREDPSNYLWSHRRWKWEWKPEYGELL